LLALAARVGMRLPFDSFARSFYGGLTVWGGALLGQGFL
jgi:hypothetical protein